jgi:hypothetical protein
MAEGFAQELSHNALIKQTAQDVLLPLGLSQLGRTRAFIDDRGWFAVIVGFQFSGFGPGSYLNVGTQWLWNIGGESGGLHLHYGARVRGVRFAEARSATFPDDIREMAKRAATEVQRYRKRFRTPALCARTLLREAERRYDWLLDAAAAWGLAGEWQRAAAAVDRHDEMASEIFTSYQSEDWYQEDPAHWDAERATDLERAAALRAALGDGTTFQSYIAPRISASRAALGMAPDFQWP